MTSGSGRTSTYRIYSDSLFQRYAFRANPPIHIIVERGNVALTGAVGTEVEKRKAESHRPPNVRRVQSRQPPDVGD